MPCLAAHGLGAYKPNPPLLEPQREWNTPASPLKDILGDLADEPQVVVDRIYKRAHVRSWRLLDTGLPKASPRKKTDAASTASNSPRQVDSDSGREAAAGRAADQKPHPGVPPARVFAPRQPQVPAESAAAAKSPRRRQSTPARSNPSTPTNTPRRNLGAPPAQPQRRKSKKMPPDRIEPLQAAGPASPDPSPRHGPDPSPRHDPEPSPRHGPAADAKAGAAGQHTPRSGRATPAKACLAPPPAAGDPETPKRASLSPYSARLGSGGGGGGARSLDFARYDSRRAILARMAGIPVSPSGQVKARLPKNSRTELHAILKDLREEVRGPVSPGVFTTPGADDRDPEPAFRQPSDASSDELDHTKPSPTIARPASARKSQEPAHPHPQHLSARLGSSLGRKKQHAAEHDALADSMWQVSEQTVSSLYLSKTGTMHRSHGRKAAANATLKTTPPRDAPADEPPLELKVTGPDAEGTVLGRRRSSTFGKVVAGGAPALSVAVGGAADAAGGDPSPTSARSLQLRKAKARRSEPAGSQQRPKPEEEAGHANSAPNSASHTPRSARGDAAEGPRQGRGPRRRDPGEEARQPVRQGGSDPGANSAPSSASRGPRQGRGLTRPKPEEDAGHENSAPNSASHTPRSARGDADKGPRRGFPGRRSPRHAPDGGSPPSSALPTPRSTEQDGPGSGRTPHAPQPDDAADRRRSPRGLRKGSAAGTPRGEKGQRLSPGASNLRRSSVGSAGCDVEDGDDDENDDCGLSAQLSDARALQRKLKQIVARQQSGGALDASSRSGALDGFVAFDNRSPRRVDSGALQPESPLCGSPMSPRTSKRGASVRFSEVVAVRGGSSSSEELPDCLLGTTGTNGATFASAFDQMMSKGMSSVFGTAVDNGSDYASAPPSAAPSEAPKAALTLALPGEGAAFARGEKVVVCSDTMLAETLVRRARLPWTDDMQKHCGNTCTVIHQDKADPTCVWLYGQRWGSWCWPVACVVKDLDHQLASCEPAAVDHARAACPAGWSRWTTEEKLAAVRAVEGKLPVPRLNLADLDASKGVADDGRPRID
ncbi:hypothetical protein DIPPA_09046 [Diplonema papillatum]|nr:hypothetical protein DIPPA_09046 [Diplonema papillatum]